MREEVYIKSDAGRKVLREQLQGAGAQKAQEIGEMPKVISVKRVGEEPVYNLEVDNTHCFAINGGFIVHNCESLRYGLMTRPSPAKRKQEEVRRRILIDPLTPLQREPAPDGFFNA